MGTPELVKQQTRPRQNDVVFDGGAGSFLVTGILCFLVTALSAGILYPWALVMKERWVVEHTIVDGRRMRFDGSAIGLFGNWIKWFLLCVVTLGWYSFWVIPAIQKWKAENTHFA